MLPVAASVAGERIGAPQQGRPPRELDRALEPAFGHSTIRVARAEEIGPLLAVMGGLIGTLADEAVVRRVAQRRPDSIWTFMRDDRIAGGLAMLMLNPPGRDALLAASLNTRDPGPEFLVGAAETPSAIYLWALAHSGASDGVLKMLVRLQSPPYDRTDLYAVPHTVSGARFQQRWGFQPIPGHPRQLSRYVRLTNRPH